MSKRKSKLSSHGIIMKGYDQHQAMLLPPDINELIPARHMVRVVDEFVAQLPIDKLLRGYKPGGASIYHPKMLLKVLLYAYVNKVYSSRQIAKALRENIHFMWLSGGNRPDFRTINGFRSSRLKGMVEEVFGMMVSYLMKRGYVKKEDVFVDGTKMEANANRHKVIWRKNTERYEAGVKEKVKELFSYIDKLEQEEDKKYRGKDLPEMGEDKQIDKEEIARKVEELERRIDERERSEKKGSKSEGANQAKRKARTKEMKKASRTLKKKARQLSKYEGQKQILGKRNSYSKTDPDATAMRSKKDQLLACYNWMITTEGQYIINSHVGQNPSDTTEFIPSMQHMKKVTGSYPTSVTGDSAFGSEQNYEYMEQQKITAYLKYFMFHPEQTKTFKENPFKKERFPYDAAQDTYICPNARKLRFKEEAQKQKPNGYRYKVRVYESEDCSGCKLAELCKKGPGNRKIGINRRLDRYKQAARALLFSEKGRKLRKRRGVEVETPFAAIKYNQGYRRFMLRGLEKVNIETKLISMAHNIRKLNQQQITDTPIEYKA